MALKPKFWPRPRPRPQGFFALASFSAASNVNTCSVLGYIVPSSLGLASLPDYYTILVLDYATVDVFANHCQQ